jgi:cell division septation protein DedD
MDTQRYRDSGGLAGREPEQRYRPPAEQNETGPDVHFEVDTSGALPAGIPVEPSTLVFEAADRGFGDIFGEMPSLTTDPLPPLEDMVEKSNGAPIDNHAAPSTFTKVSARSDEQDFLPTRRIPIEGANSQVLPTGHLPLTPNEFQPRNGQSSPVEPHQKPFLRRAGSRTDEGLPDFAQAIHSTDQESFGADTSLSELAEATGLRRNTGPVDNGSPRNYPSAPLHPSESLSEYPVLIDGHKPTLWSRLRWPVVAMLLLAFLATAGYFLGFQKLIGGSSQARQSANLRPADSDRPATANAQSQTEAVSKPSETTPKPAEASTPSENATATKAPEPAPAVAPPPVAPGDAQPTHSLQAASFPNEAGAREFAEKLIRAGVPSYVVAVDIPRRGKWFRIRVGQFPNAAEATKYAAQARQRAKAAGFNLDLIVCNYEKP